MEESKLSDPIKLSEKRNEDEVILQMEEFKSSDPIKPRSIESDKVIRSDQDRYMIIVIVSLILCSILIIFPTLKMSSYGGKFMEEHDIVITLFLSPLVIFFQLWIVVITTDHPVNDSIFSILFLLLLSSGTSIMEVSLVSHSTCIVTLVLWLFWIAIVVWVNWQQIANVVRVNWQKISSYDISLASQGMMKFIPTICDLSLVCNIIFLVHIFSS
uniref:Uncharacterized protein LOC101513925 n=1 Tax=Cicer arietinum TaxID=3827 RepID=A0A1S2Z8K5_CICAR|nr:uncharacterized protein LOC101513925 [Cicer arietinum]